MANSLRIDGYTLSEPTEDNPEGILTFRLQYGDSPLPVALSNDGLNFAGGRTEFAAALQTFEVAMQDQLNLLLLLCSQPYKSDPQLSTATLDALVGQTITVNFTAPSNTITIG